ncbi:helix-turn-helix domain-containing protein [Barnesiella sp. An55]|uniref:helix-turn-helix domain-containing protein n=1 Tax=Barnesiella sp. An55 TaxID=1965646 RepID=UPI000B37DC2E|nr:helix-turn-helix domain-containing protein [Barnesiella sp. An55]OUN72649.1 hypothetical protein B5G10_07120 [Barnesiella sp. An55]
MEQNPTLSTLNLHMLPFNERACVYHNELFLSDNFDDSNITSNLLDNPEVLTFITSPYPFKIQFAMMILCLNGHMRVNLNLNEYELQRNCIQIVTPGAIAQCVEITPDSRMAIIAFDTVNNIPENNTQSALIMRKFLINNAMLQLSDREMDEMMELYHHMRQKILRPEELFTHEILNNYTQIFYYNICQLMSPYVEQQDTQYVSRKKQIFDQFIELLRQHYTQERSIGFYANQLCITPKYLSQVIFDISNRHAGDWIRDYVILEAKALLKSGKYNVQQVSDLLNFANQSFFGSYFKKAVGCSPSAYQDS